MRSRSSGPISRNASRSVGPGVGRRSNTRPLWAGVWHQGFPHTAVVEEAVLARSHIDRGSRAWSLVWRAGYAVLRRLGPVVRVLVGLGVPTLGDSIVELGIVGRRTGRPRTVLVTLLRIDGRWYVGHPDGPCAWLANLAAMDSLLVTLPHRAAVRVRPVFLSPGPERDAV